MRILVAGNLDLRFVTALVNEGFELTYTKPNNDLMDGLTFHPDMQIARYEDKLICDPNMYPCYKDIIQDGYIQLLCGNVKAQCNYPEDIAYNIKAVGKYVFHNFKYTDSFLNTLISQDNRINVSQGYSGCSICTVSENAIITADRGIHKAAIEAGIDSLLISPGFIMLEKFDYGFIGGASFNYNGKLYFFGDLSTHPDCKLISEFCAQYGTKIVSLADGTLTDYGSSITLD